MTTEDIASLDVWLRGSWPDGLILVGGCCGDGTPFCHPFDEKRAASVAQECWTIFNEAVVQLDAYGFENRNMVWVFETVILWVAVRGDGAWAGILSHREITESKRTAIKSRLADFIDSF
jgi:hypothetical protein